MSYETANHLDAAADYIEKNGWHQGDFYQNSADPGDGVPACALGALIAVTERMDHRYPIARMALEGVLPPGNPDVAVVPEWNDAPERTKQEVLDKFRLAAKNERIATDGLGGDAA